VPDAEIKRKDEKWEYGHCYDVGSVWAFCLSDLNCKREKNLIANKLTTAKSTEDHNN
jgi:hypothetical protein